MDHRSVELSSFDRRRVLEYTWNALCASVALGLSSHGEALNPPRFGRNPFTLGVASGDPTPDGIVVWTRLAPEPRPSPD